TLFHLISFQKSGHRGCTYASDKLGILAIFCCFVKRIFDKMYSGLTKTSTALPRLAVLSVLSAASSPCPDFC
ncbi:hypothetical protein LN384_27710, partial [Enterobacter hormaechei subsp. steigerwaltii]|nr:hypothetical protein [Enterobacter hormaechei subsp. steigerwaltii]